VEKNKRYRIVFMGTPEFAVPSLNALLEGPDDVVCVVTQPDRPRGRGRKLVPSPVKEVAQKNGIAVLQPERAREPGFVAEMKRLGPDLLVVAAYGQILSQELLDVPSIMPVNVHGSLLPKYRGAAPIQWAIMEGEKETGITIMKMDAGMDTGPILLQRGLKIGPEETFGELYERMAHLGAELIMEALEKLKTSELVPIPQPEEGVSLAPPISRQMAHIDWELPAQKVSNLIRALDPKPGAYTYLEGNRIRLFRPVAIEGGADKPPGTLLSLSDKGIEIATGKGSVLIREIHWPGKKRLSVANFLRGRALKEGIRFN